MLSSGPSASSCPCVGIAALGGGNLSVSGLYTTYAYRSLIKSLSWRAVELPLAAELNRQVDRLQIDLAELRGLQTGGFSSVSAAPGSLRIRMIRDQFRLDLDEVDQTLCRYRSQLEHSASSQPKIADNHPEWSTVHKIEAAADACVKPIATTTGCWT